MKETIDKTFTFEDAQRIADIGVRLGHAVESIKRFGYPERDGDSLIEDIRQYQEVLQPVVRKAVSELTKKGNGTYGLEETLIDEFKEYPIILKSY